MVSTVTSSELAKVIGPTQSAGSIERICHELRLSAKALRQEDCERILGHLGKAPGLEGMAARFAKAQVALLFANKMTESRSSAPARSQRISGGYRTVVRNREARLAVSKRVPSSRLAAMFSAGVPRAAAEQALEKAAKEVGTAEPDRFTLEEVEKVLDTIAEMGSGWRSQVQLVRTRMRTGSSF